MHFLSSPLIQGGGGNKSILCLFLILLRGWFAFPRPKSPLPSGAVYRVAETGTQTVALPAGIPVTPHLTPQDPLALQQEVKQCLGMGR